MKTFWTGVSGTLLRHQNLGDVEIDYRRFLGNDFVFDRAYERVLAGAQLVHSAAIVGEPNCQSDSDLTKKVNIEGAARLASECARVGVRRFIYISTSHVYAPSQNPINESGDLLPRSLYAESKLRGEERVRAIGEDSEMEISVLRLFSLIGDAKVQSSFAGLLGRIIEGSHEKIRFSDDVRDFQTPEQYWDLMGLVLMVDALPEVINVASGIGISISQAALEFASHKGITLDPAVFIRATSDVPHLVADVSLFKSVTGATPAPLSFKN